MRFEFEIKKGSEVLMNKSVTSAHFPEEAIALMEMVSGTEMYIKRKE